MIALITAQKPKFVGKQSQILEIPPKILDSRKSRLVAKWLSDDQGHLHCQWVKELH